jgi:two-component system chemotaxis response regulator CheY
MSGKQVLSLGQCGADHYSISRLLSGEFGAEVTAASTSEEALAKLRQGDFALVLVNRVLDYDGGSGLDFIARLKSEERLRSLPVMLVSNYPEAQDEAVQKGAELGFGKAQLSAGETIGRLRAFLE